MRSLTALEVKPGMSIVYKSRFKGIVIDTLTNDTDVVLFLNNGSSVKLGASEYVIQRELHHTGHCFEIDCVCKKSDCCPF